MRKIILTQIGARHRYEIAKMLYNNELLHALYTDSSNFSLLGRLSSILKHLHPAIQKLSNRKIDQLPSDKVMSTDTLFYNNFFQKQQSFKQQNLRNHLLFSKKAISWGVKGADALYHMYIENLDFVRYAKSKNLKIITDVYISPVTENIMIKEHENYPFLKNVNYDNNDLSIYRERIIEAFELSDILLCPSTWVAKGVLEINPAVEEKIKIVPYGSSISFKDISNTPKFGRFLFVGYDVSRKGLVYLGKAASILKKQNANIDIRVAGLKREGELTNEVFKDLNFLGKLNFEDLREEYSTADCFVLPSFSEGLAGVLVEAMSAGLPIIATLSSGVNFEHEINGLVIEPGSVNDIVDSCKRIIEDRDLREKLAKNSANMSSYYTVESWEERLVKVLKEI